MKISFYKGIKMGGIAMAGFLLQACGEQRGQGMIQSELGY